MLNKHFGCCRLVYNKALAKKKELYEKDKTNISCYDLQNELPKLKEELIFLKEVNSQSLQNIIVNNLDKAFKNFFRRIKNNDKEKGFPKFKSKHSNNQSFTCPQNIKVNFQYNKLTIPKIKNIKTVFHREFTGIIKSCTISKTCTNKYYASILVEDNEDLPLKSIIEEKTSIGLDLGITHFLTTSTGIKINNPRFLKENLIHLKYLQRQLSKKVKGSNNRCKAKLRVALQHEKIVNMRKDFLNKLSSKLISENKTICIEDLNISGMLKNHNLAMSIQDVSWSEFVRQLKYKSEWNGKNLLQCGRFDATSKTCTCGCKNNELSLKDRTWQCKNCGLIHDRDVLAANNIKLFALDKSKQTRSERPEELVEMSTVVESMKQEASTSVSGR
jgi:putative transposase